MAFAGAKSTQNQGKAVRCKEENDATQLKTKIAMAIYPGPFPFNLLIWVNYSGWEAKGFSLLLWDPYNPGG
jgi:hypothetical protein